MDDSRPATKGDVQAVRADLQNLARSMNAQFSKVHEDIDRVLEVLVNVDKRLTGKVEDHEKRIVRLEEAVA